MDADKDSNQASSEKVYNNNSPTLFYRKPKMSMGGAKLALKRVRTEATSGSSTAAP